MFGSVLDASQGVTVIADKLDLDFSRLFLATFLGGFPEVKKNWI